MLETRTVKSLGCCQRMKKTKENTEGGFFGLFYLFIFFIFKETVLLFTKTTFIYSSPALSNTYAHTASLSALSPPLCFSDFLYLNSSVMQPTKGKQCRVFFPLGTHSSFSCNTVDVQKWSENPSKNFIAGRSPRQCQQ